MYQQEYIPRSFSIFRDTCNKWNLQCLYLQLGTYLLSVGSFVTEIKMLDFKEKNF